MLLSVRHVTTYRYDRPVRGLVQSHRLTPAASDCQKVLAWDVSVSDGLKGGGFRDGAGDWVQGWSVPGPVEQVAVTVTGLVETTDTAGVLRGFRERVPPMVFLRETAATRPSEGIAALALAARGATDALGAAHALAAAVADAIVWTPGATRHATTAAEALALGEGVCQDHAQVLISAARLAGLPARYVAGYFLAEPIEGESEAAHAWAEIWIERLGWVGFDPANRCCPDARYIRLGSGLDALDAAPIRGIARGPAGTESMTVSVQVARGQQQTQQ